MLTSEEEFHMEKEEEEGVHLLFLDQVIRSIMDQLSGQTFSE